MRPPTPRNNRYPGLRPPHLPPEAIPCECPAPRWGLGRTPPLTPGPSREARGQQPPTHAALPGAPCGPACARTAGRSGLGTAPPAITVDT